MPVKDRAAQFAPFAALTGHDAAVRETARLTAERIELDENEIAVINQKLQYIYNNIVSCQNDGTEPDPVEITYFIKDSKKDGGMYVTATGQVKRFLQQERIIIMKDGIEIPVNDIIKIK
jgi:hypothetical protein